MPWSQFKTIIEKDDTGVEETLAQRGIVVANNGGVLTVSGLNDGDTISVYDLQGAMLAQGKENGGMMQISVNGEDGKFVILKVGNESIKVMM